MPTIAECLKQAWRHQQAGALPQAEMLCRQILQANPAQADALYLLGVMAHQVGRFELAIAYQRQALTVQPNAVACHCSLGMALQALGKVDESIASYHQALQIQPNHADTLNCLGTVLHGLGKLAEAETSYRRALQAKPDYSEAQNNLGAVFHEQGRLEEAAACYQKALELTPRDAETLNNLGVVLMHLKRLPEAVARLEQSLHVRPGHADAHNNLGLVRAEQGDLNAAVACYHRALQLRPDFAEAHNNLGLALADQGKPEEAIVSYRQSLYLRPRYADAHLNLAMTLLMVGQFEQGWAEYEWRWHSSQFVERSMSAPRWNGSPLDGKTILLSAEQGLGDAMQFVRFAPFVKERGGHHPRSQTEFGNEGDGKVILECEEGLCSLLATCSGVDEVVARGAALPHYDTHVPLLSLPNILGTTLQNIPAGVPYLFPDPKLVSQWRAVIDKETRRQGDRETGRQGDKVTNSPEMEPGSLSPCLPVSLSEFRVGIVWQGRIEHIRDRLRSVSLNHFAQLTQIHGVQLYSLQKGPGIEQLMSSSLPCPTHHSLLTTHQSTIIDLGSRCETFMDTAAILMNLDLVVTIDTAVAHCAGALGVPVWLVVPFVPDWRWLLNRDDSPWYPTMRLFRRKEGETWDDVFERVRQDLQSARLQRAAGAHTSLTPAGIRRG